MTAPDGGSAITITKGRIRVTLFSEGGTGVEQFVRGIGWVIADDVPCDAILECTKARIETRLAAAIGRAGGGA